MGPTPSPSSNAGGGPTSRILYPMVGFKGDGNAVTIRNCKCVPITPECEKAHRRSTHSLIVERRWISRPSEMPAAHLGSVLEAATLLQHWDRPPAAYDSAAAVGPPLPAALLSEAYCRYRAMYAAGE